MKKILFIMACMTGVFMASCEKDPDMGELDADLVVYTDHDSNTDFSSFQTYFLPDSILEASGVHASYWKDENAKMIISAVESQMNRRGYERITDPELKDQANIGLQLSYVSQTNQVITGGGYWGDPFGGWWSSGFWGPWWSGWYYSYPVTYSYDTNTLVMEIVDLTDKSEDGTQKKLPVVWYASVSGFQYNNSKINMQLLLNGVDQAFNQSTYINTEK